MKSALAFRTKITSASFTTTTSYRSQVRSGSDLYRKKINLWEQPKKAVQKAVQWFWKDFKGVLGPAHKVMTVDDPHEEVSYDEDFACNDLGHKYLDESTLERLLAEADGSWLRMTA